MSFTRVRSPGAWLDGGVALQAEFEKFDDQLSNAIDGRHGGAYAPDADLVIGGKGIRIQGTHDGGLAGLICESHLLVTGSNILCDANAYLTNLYTFGPSVFGSTAEFDYATTFDATATFNALVEIQDGIHFGGAGTVSIERPVLISGATTFTCHADAVFDGTVKIEAELSFATGLGAIRQRVTYGTDADATLTYGITGTVHVWRSSGITATRNITLADATNVGSQLELVNWSPHDMNIKNSSGSLLFVLPALDGSLNPGYAHIIWHDSGSSTQWHQTHVH